LPARQHFVCDSTIMARMSFVTTLTYRNRDGELVDVPTVAATRFKNEFGAIFEQATLNGAIAITKHNTPKAVLLSYAEFQALTRASSPVLDELTEQFDRLLEGMQSQRSKAAMAEAFKATPEQLGRAAVKAARPKRRR
jgi:antitoxin Phd